MHFSPHTLEMILDIRDEHLRVVSHLEMAATIVDQAHILGQTRGSVSDKARFANAVRLKR